MDDVDRLWREIERAINAECSCGGGGYELGCTACRIWHRLRVWQGRKVVSEKAQERENERANG